MAGGREKNATKERKRAAEELSQRASKNLVFGTIAAILGGALTVWSSRQGGDIGVSITQIIYWGLVAGGAIEGAVGIWQLYQAREIREGRASYTATTSPPPATIDPSASIEVTLHAPRGKYIGWGLFSLLIGALFFHGFGTPGLVIGVAWWLLSAYNGYRWLSTSLGHTQAIRISADKITLPRSLTGKRSADVRVSDVSHIYLLRRSVPLFHAPPLLVIDVDDESLSYPRDWFRCEQDQERVFVALRGRITFE